VAFMLHHCFLTAPIATLSTSDGSTSVIA